MCVCLPGRSEESDPLELELQGLSGARCGFWAPHSCPLIKQQWLLTTKSFSRTPVSVFWFQNESQGSESTEWGPHVTEPRRAVLLTSQASSRLELTTTQAPPHPLSKEKLVTLQMVRDRGQGPCGLKRKQKPKRLNRLQGPRGQVAKI